MPQNALLAASAGQVSKTKRAMGVVRLSLACAMACFTLGAIQAAHAQAAPAAAAPTDWFSTIKYSGEVDGGISGNFDPKGGLNFGQSTTDHPNQATLNAIFATIERDPDTSTSTFDWGFKLQGEYGSDVRYNRYLGEFNKQTSRYQGEVTQAYLTAHIGGLFSGGTDVTVGQYVTPIGDEVIDPRVNPFYSHSYIYSYGLPVAHTGGYVVMHPAIADIYAGMDSGVNTTFANGDNNGSASYLFGVGKTIGSWTVLALAHIGPEDGHDNANTRTYADAVITYKATSALTLTTELDYVHDTASYLDRPTAYGATEYASYTLDSQTTLNGRIEVFNDQNSFFVGNPTSNNVLNTSFYGSPVAPKATTYGELTLGATYNPPGLPGLLSTLEIRPEVRVDSALNGVKTFESQSNSTQVTLATDVNLSF